MFDDQQQNILKTMNSSDVIGAGPSGSRLKTLNNRNNLANLYLKKRLEHFSREKTFRIAHLDRDRFDTLDFLQNICKVESDSHPAARM